MGGEETNWVGGPIKSVKIVWSRELCSRGALPGDPGATGRPLEEVLVGRLEPLSGQLCSAVTLEALRVDEGRPEGTQWRGGGQSRGLFLLAWRQRRRRVGADEAGRVVFTTASQGLCSPALLGQFRNQF